MNNNFDDGVNNEVKNMLIESLQENGLYTTFQMLQGAEKSSKFWKKYVEDRLKDKEEEDNEKEDSENNDILDVMLNAFGIRKTEKMDEASEEFWEDFSENMNEVIDAALKDNEVIEDVKNLQVN